MLTIRRVFLLTGSLLAAALQADEWLLADGRAIEGDPLPAQRAGEIRTSVGAQGFQATVNFRADLVIRHRAGDSARQARVRLLDARRVALGDGGDGAAWWELAEGYRSADEPLAAKLCLRRTVAADPGHAQARARLGQVLHDGRWMSAADAAAARGEVWFRGAWTTPARRDALLAEESRAAAERLAAARARRDERIAAAQERARLAALAPEPEPRSIVLIQNVPSPWIGDLAGNPAPRPPLLSLGGTHGGMRWSFTWP